MKWQVGRSTPARSGDYRQNDHEALGTLSTLIQSVKSAKSFTTVFLMIDGHLAPSPINISISRRTLTLSSSSGGFGHVWQFVHRPGALSRIVMTTEMYLGAGDIHQPLHPTYSSIQTARPTFRLQTLLHDNQNAIHPCHRHPPRFWSVRLSQFIQPLVLSLVVILFSCCFCCCRPSSHPNVPASSPR